MKSLPISVTIRYPKLQAWKELWPFEPEETVGIGVMLCVYGAFVMGFFCGRV